MPKLAAVGDLDAAKHKSESAITLEQFPLAVDEAQSQHNLTVRRDKIDPDLAPFVGALLDPVVVQAGRRAYDCLPCRVEHGDPVIVRLAGSIESVSHSISTFSRVGALTQAVTR
jgi:hypothetical protein